MNAAYAAYILISAAVTALIYSSPALDFRGVGALKRRPRNVFMAEEEAYERVDVDRRALAKERRRVQRISVAPRADLTVLLAIGGAAALALGAFLGFIGPRLIEAVAQGAPVSDSTGAPATLDSFRYAAASPMGRLAQIAGAALFLAAALRMLRAFIGLAALAAAVIAVQLALNFVIGRPLLALFGV